ncbi:MAG: hypothetical protein KatS3mg011_2000 [Acidimicrobiia bacterium]|nr:MAG: hypothetical protein KatS3mg011_2000 [Acidimicrobiia bacterium]
MLALWSKITAWLSDEERGASMVEYALLVVLDRHRRHPRHPPSPVGQCLGDLLRHRQRAWPVSSLSLRL